MVTLATTATSTAGSTAMIENRLTIWTCSRAAALPAPAGLDHLPDLADDDADQQQDGRRIDQQEAVDDLRASARSGSGRSGPRRSGRPTAAPSATANGASQRRSGQPWRGSANERSKLSGRVSALVIQAIGELKRVSRGRRGLMHSYHIVAELRQFRGARFPAAFALTHLRESPRSRRLSQPPLRYTWISRSRIFLRSVLRLRPSRSAARIWLPRVAASAAVSSGTSISFRMR